MPYMTLIYPLYSLIKPLYNPKGPFKGLSFSPLINPRGQEKSCLHLVVSLRRSPVKPS